MRVAGIGAVASYFLMTPRVPQHFLHDKQEQATNVCSETTLGRSDPSSDDAAAAEAFKGVA